MRYIALLLLIAPAALSATVLRGPYLQGGGPEHMIVKWRTDKASRGTVCIGKVPGKLGRCQSERGKVKDHEVLFEKLEPATRYYYSFDGQKAEDQYFVTSPPAGSAQDTRIWVLGDAGTADERARRTKRSWQAYSQGRRADLVLQMGDNAYTSGTDGQYQRALFQTFPELLKNNVFWSCLGNHETYNGDKVYPYFHIFSFPTNGELGGLASGTERYYSFDYANIHFITLDPNEKADRKPGSAQLKWLEADLAQNRQEWTIAFWHQTPYTKGSHDSDTENDIIDMRTNVNPILEAAGVDLVLSGHTHAYERSYLIDGHYGLSKTFNRKKHVRDLGDKKWEGVDLYAKPGPRQAHTGTTYVVMGCSAKTDGGPLNHPAMKTSIGDTLGSLVIDVRGSVLKSSFLTDKGEIKDSFIIAHGPLPTATVTSTVTPYAGTPTLSATATPSPSVTLTSTLSPTPGPVFVINTFEDAEANSEDVNDRHFSMGEGGSSKAIAYANGVMDLDYFVVGGNNYTWWYTALECLRSQRYDVLEMRLKGKDGGEKFDVILESLDAACKGKDRDGVHIEDFATLTKEWQTVAIPMKAFKKLKSRILGSILLAEFRAGNGVWIDDIQLKEKEKR